MRPCLQKRRQEPAKTLQGHLWTAVDLLTLALVLRRTFGFRRSEQITHNRSQHERFRSVHPRPCDGENSTTSHQRYFIRPLTARPRPGAIP